MRTVFFYLLRQQIVATVFVAVALTCAIWLTQSLNFVKLIVNRGLALLSFLEFTVLLLPSFLLLILPIALFFSVLFTYNKMINDRELIVMRATGLSHLGLARPAVTLAAIVTLIGYAISFYVMPVSFRLFKETEFAIRNDFSVLLLQEGMFNTVAKKVTVYVREREGDKELMGILVQDDRQAEKPVTMTAERGVLLGDNDQPRIVMFNGTRQELDRKTGKVSLLFFDRWGFTIDWTSKTSERRWREPNERFIDELLWPGDSANERYYRKMLVAEGHNRLITPLYAIVFVLIAVTGILSGQFNKRGQIHRVLATVTAMLLVQAGAIGLSNLAAKVPAVIPLMYLNAALPVVVCLLALARGPAREGPRQISGAG